MRYDLIIVGGGIGGVAIGNPLQQPLRQHGGRAPREAAAAISDA